MNPYVELIEKLIKGEIEKIEVERKNVMAFIEVWNKNEDRKRIVGEAAHHGNVTYRYIR
ncbi:hypothetical protein [Enterococcus olivae]